MSTERLTPATMAELLDVAAKHGWGYVSCLVSEDGVKWRGTKVIAVGPGNTFMDYEGYLRTYAMPALGAPLLTAEELGRVHSEYLRTGAVPPMHAEGTKHDDGKPRWTLVPWRAMESVVAVLEHGAKKYGDDNWRHVPNASRRYVDAAARHLITHMRGDELDRESGLPHLAHAVCSILFLLENMRGLDAE